jgi:hypothetical protein
VRSVGELNSQMRRSVKAAHSVVGVSIVICIYQVRVVS